MNTYKAASLKFVTYDIKDTTHRRGDARRLSKKAHRKARHELNGKSFRKILEEVQKNS